MRRIYAIVIALMAVSQAAGAPLYPIEGLATPARRRTQLSATATADASPQAQLNGVNLLTAGNLTVNSGDPWQWNVVGTGLELEGIGGTWVADAALNFDGRGANVSVNEGELADCFQVPSAPSAPDTPFIFYSTVNSTRAFANPGLCDLTEIAQPVIHMQIRRYDVDYLNALTSSAAYDFTDASGMKYYHGGNTATYGHYFDINGNSDCYIRNNDLQMPGAGCAIYLGTNAWPAPQANSFHGFSVLATNDFHAGDGIYAGDPDGSITGTVNLDGYIRSYDAIQGGPINGYRTNLAGLLIHGALTTSQLWAHAETDAFHFDLNDDSQAFTGTEVFEFDKHVLFNTTIAATGAATLTGGFSTGANSSVTGTFDSSGALTENSARVVIPSRVTNGSGIVIASNDTNGTVQVTCDDTLDKVTTRGSSTGNSISVAGINIGTGTNITKHLSATGTLNFDLTAVVVEDLTITVTGAADGDTVSVGVPNGSVTTTVQYTGWVSAADTVTVRARTSAAGENPASGTFRADVWKH